MNTTRNPGRRLTACLGCCMNFVPLLRGDAVRRELEVDNSVVSQQCHDLCFVGIQTLATLPRREQLIEYSDAGQYIATNVV